MPIFYVLYLEDGLFGDCLEAIRLLCEPTEKIPSHVTVRGPYRFGIKTGAMTRKLRGNHIDISEIGNFFEYNQNTVFFRCNSSVLKEIWYKPDFPFNPHVTIYDGPCEAFARELFDIADQYSYSFSLKAERLEPLTSRKGQKGFILQLWSTMERVSDLLGERLEPSQVEEMSLSKRLELIDRLFRQLSTSPEPKQLSLATTA